MRTSQVLRKLVLLAGLAALPAASFGGIFISVGFAPPALPVYAQPICPSDGYLWTPGYWAYSPDGYYWVPGVWVQPPTVGYLWTPGYWGWGGSAFLFHEGYWGPHIGFYGGVNYGFGYGGVGYEGGYWNHGAFAYNRSVNNINVTNVHNVYNKTVIVNNNTTINRVSYNGGTGGLQARPTQQEQAAVHEEHVQPTANQMSHQQSASQNRAQFASANGGHPQMAAQARVGDRSSAVPARGYNGPQQSGGGNAQRGFGGQANTAQAQRGAAGQPNNAGQQRGFAAQPNNAQAQRPTGNAGQPNGNQSQARPQQAQPQQQARPAQGQAQPRQSAAQPRPQSQPHESQAHAEPHEHR